MLGCVLLLLTMVVPLSTQVNITITGNGNSLTGNAIMTNSLGLPTHTSVTFAIATCPDIPPGICCQPPRRLSVLGTGVTFSNLHVTDIGAVWTGKHIVEGDIVRGIVRGCSGRVLASRTGPGEWQWRLNDELAVGGRRAEGASYITVPANLAPDPTTSDWLTTEGLLALVWGGGQWFASSSAARLLGGGGSIPKGRARLRRSVRSADKGTVYARPPLRVRYPSFIELNGTQYAEVQAGQFIYADTAGNMLNLTDSFLG